MQRLLPVMMRIQAHLDTDLSLKRLAATARLSPYHFHRVFREAVGETPKQYTQRLRLERAAHRLILHDATVLDIALDAGFQNHETFSREFKKRFRVSPRDYRAWQRRKLPGPEECVALEESAGDFQLSATRVRRLEYHGILRLFAPFGRERTERDLKSDFLRLKQAAEGVARGSAPSA